MSYELFDHTADVGINAHGEDLEEAFEETAKGMFSIMTDLSKVDENEEHHIEIEEDKWESLLIQFLSELIYLHEVKSVLFREFEVKLEESEERKKITAKAVGEEIDLEKHEIDTAVKAVSYHDLTVDIEGNIKIILDI
ncbi:MAG: archease [Candidatus Thermoplasmatota archaeon]